MQCVMKAWRFLLHRMCSSALYGNKMCEHTQARNQLQYRASLGKLANDWLNMSLSRLCFVKFGRLRAESSHAWSKLPALGDHDKIG